MHVESVYQTKLKKEGRVGCEEALGVDILKGVSLHKLCKYDIV